MTRALWGRLAVRAAMTAVVALLSVQQAAAGALSFSLKDGRVTIPAEIRRALGLRGGTIVTLEVRGDGLLVRKAEEPDEAPRDAKRENDSA